MKNIFLIALLCVAASCGKPNNAANTRTPKLNTSSENDEYDTGYYDDSYYSNEDYQGDLFDDPWY